MPEKQLTTISYAAGASLAAIALVYVFAPNFAIDQSSTSSSRKKGVVGLRNFANDCFINSTLQALAGLSDLRVYLIRETHRRSIEDPNVYAYLVQPPNGAVPTWKLQGLQRGLVTQGLKEMLDALNERPIYKKSTSAVDFIRVLETAFRQRISRQQQDAQEFLQIVAERLKDEYHAGERAREHAKNNKGKKEPGTEDEAGDGEVLADAGAEGQPNGQNRPISGESSASASASNSNSDVPAIQTNGGSTLDLGDETEAEGDAEADIDDGGFPMEGQHESQLQCQTCAYKPPPKTESFVTLTLNVPHVRSTSLNACFDEIFKTEYIDDFKCEKCRLLHAADLLERELASASSEAKKERLASDLQKVRDAIENDPETPPEGVELPDLRQAPKRRIARSARITSFPKVLTIHLSRSIFDTQASTKNSAKVSFPDLLSLGSLADRRSYKLLGLVTHKGSHNSGHYESFRRQNPAHAPYPNSNPFQVSGIYSKSVSPSSTPRLGSLSRSGSPIVSTPDLLPPSPSYIPEVHPLSSTPSLVDSQLGSDTSGASPRRQSSLRHRISPTSAPRDQQQERDKEKETGDVSSIRSVAVSTRSALSRLSRPRSGSGSPSPSPRAASGASTPDVTGDIPGPMPLLAPTMTPVAPAPKPRHNRRRKLPDRWWRISDEKIRAAKTSEVLGMQKEVYLLFYEMEKEEEGPLASL